MSKTLKMTAEDFGEGAECGIIAKETALFSNTEILNDSKSAITAVSFLNSFVAPPGKDPPRIVLHILPLYSPNFNPIERIWNVMNEHVRNNKAFPSFHLFRDAVIHFFNHTWHARKNKMHTRINDNFQVFNTASSVKKSIDHSCWKYCSDH